MIRINYTVTGKAVNSMGQGGLSETKALEVYTHGGGQFYCLTPVPVEKIDQNCWINLSKKDFWSVVRALEENGERPEEEAAND